MTFNHTYTKITLKYNSKKNPAMQKYHLLIILSLINLSADIHAMKKEAKSIDPFDLSILLTYPNKVLDRIAQFLPFHDYETEEEFIERTRALNTRTEYLRKHITSFDIKYSAYSPDNTKVILSEKLQNSDMEIINENIIMPKLIIIDRQTKQVKELCIGKTHQKLAVANNKNYFATIYPETVLDKTAQQIIQKHSLVITCLNFKLNKNYDIPTSLELCDKHPTIAFNKQDTHIIIHAKNNLHIIFSINNSTQNSNVQNKTLPKYFKQRGICKDLTTQIIKQNNAICRCF